MTALQKKKQQGYQERWREKLRRRGGRLIDGRVVFRALKATRQQISDDEMDRRAAEMLCRDDGGCCLG